MELILDKKIGKHTYQFVVAGKNLHEVVMEKEKLAFGNVDKCGICDSDNLDLRAYITEEKGYKYVKVQCWKCGASLTFGQPTKSPDTFYYRKTDDGKLNWQAKQEEK